MNGVQTIKHFPIIVVVLISLSFHSISFAQTTPLKLQPNSIEDICGSDNRVPSNDPAIGRLFFDDSPNFPCTAWLLPSGKLVTAGHCTRDLESGDWVEFNVPQSASNGSPQHPGPEDRYTVDMSSIIKSDNGSGNDWAVFDVFVNSQTGLTPLEAQNAYYEIAQSNGGNTITITGYGTAISELNKTQQTNTGVNEGRDGNIIKYVVDTNPGNSGSPIIDFATGKAIGVHTNGNCADDGYNFGTSFFNSNFWNAAYSTLFIQVTINQLRTDGQTQIGTVGRWGGSDFLPRFAAPGILSFMVQTTEVLHADPAMYSCEKYHNWNNENDVTNHHLFDVDAGFPNSLNANFKQIYGNVIIESMLIGTSGQGGDSIKFKDPWLIDFADPEYDNNLRNRGMDAPLIAYNSPLTITTTSAFKGVFLNQSGPPLWNPPFYTVRVEEQTINGTTYFLENWSGSNVSFEDAAAEETAVVFTAVNATVTANLKGHQVSNNTNATAGNNSRKVVWAEPGATAYYFQTYLDNGHVYYTWSSDGGANWEREERVTQTNGNSEPSIAVSEDMSKITVVWNNNGEFLWRSKSGVSGSWGSIYSETPMFPSSVSTKPAALNHGGNIYVAKRYKYSSNPQIVELYKINSSNQLTWLGQIDGSGADNPTITKRYPANYDNRVFIAWEKSNGIYYRTFNTGNSTFSSIETVATPGGGIYFHNTPNIAYSLDNRINIAWAGSSGSVKYLLSRSKSVNSSSWGAQSTIYTSYSDLTQPSIGAFYDATHSGWLNVAVKLGSNSVRTLQWNKSNWVFHSTWLSGQHPSMTDKADGDLLLVGTDHTSGSPYGIFNKAYTAGQLSKQLSTETMEIATHIRREGLDLANLPGNLQGVVNVEVGELSVNGEQWYFMEDSTAIARGIFMQSNPLTVSANTQNALLRYAATVEDFQKPGNGVPNVPLLRLRLIDAASGATLRQAASVHLKDLRDGNWQKDDTLSIDLSEFHGKTVALQMQTVRHFLDNSGSADYINLYRFDDATTTQPLAKRNVETLPTEFALEQNYPNPFNPVTAINYQLPSVSDVKLKIYNTLGQLVKTLVSQKQSAGNYAVQWDGTNDLGERVASGIYIYRLQAGDFIQSRKMILMK